ncbi:MAG TPA: NifB/NifX family molybdenum-iron cluster-binding protein [Candidatus Cloacimonadota bacterium]|jgi:predicted Fe-Mo cluster-binding NifX family protein|nr:NifB/NifX family molybdenum-iron cluster-binding protein [Candidatus Cloacimonadota bacterium]
MKIAFTTYGTDWDARIDPRFGRTDYLLFYDEESKTMSSVDNREIINVEHGAGPKTAQKIFDNGAQVLITGNGPGGNAARILDQMELKIYVGAGGMTVREAYNAYLNNQLKQGVNNA